MKKITGYVGNILVIAYQYPGLDAGFNHYSFNGRTYMGTVNFTRIVKEEVLDY